MGLFSAKPVEPVEAVPVVAVGPVPGERFEGPCAFSDGFYYPVVNDEHGREVGPNRDQPLVWLTPEHSPDGGNGLYHAAPEDPNHFHRYGLNPAEIVPDGEPV